MNRIPTIGFVGAPAWLDPAPSEFPEVVAEDIETQQAPLLLPEFDLKARYGVLVYIGSRNCLGIGITEKGFDQVAGRVGLFRVEPVRR